MCAIPDAPDAIMASGAFLFPCLYRMKGMGMTYQSQPVRKCKNRISGRTNEKGR